MNIWRILGVSATADEREIRRAYARRLKDSNPEDDPEGFKTLREAYEAALLRTRRFPPAPAATLVSAFESFLAAEGPHSRSVDEFPDTDSLTVEGESPVAEFQPDEMICARTALLEALRDGAPVDDLQATLATVLDAPQMAQVDVTRETECWLAQLIVDFAPVSDALVAPCERHFQWRERAKAYRRDPRITEALQRAEDLRALRTACSSGSKFRAAFRALMRAPKHRRLKLQTIFTPLASQVEKVLAVIDRDRPSLLVNLDPDALVWWRTLLSRPHFPGRIWLWTAPAMTILTVVFLASSHFQTWMGAVGASIGFAVAAGPFLMKTYVVDIYFGERYRRWIARLPNWKRGVWAPGGVLLLLVAALAPGGWPVASSSFTVSSILTAWAFFSAPPSARTGAMPAWLGALWFHFGLVLWWASMGDYLGARWAQISLPLVLLIFAWARGSDLLQMLWEDIGEVARLATSTVSAALCIVAGFGLTLDEPRHIAPVLAAIISALALCSVVTSIHLGALVLKVRHYAMWLVLMAIFAGAEDHGRYMAGGLILLAGAFVPAVMSVRYELRPKRRRSPPWT